MKKFVLTILAIAVAASPALAQVGDISAYADGAGTSCNIVDTAPGIITVNILHKHTVGGTASQWAVVSDFGREGRGEPVLRRGQLRQPVLHLPLVHVGDDRLPLRRRLPGRRERLRQG